MWFNPFVNSELDPFYVAIAPVRDALQALIESIPTEPAIASADSPAMHEIALQAPYVGPWGGEPAEHTQVLGIWKRTMAVDCSNAMIRDLKDDPAPMFAYKVLSRAVIENAASAAWLLEPKLALRVRIARGRNERIHSAQQILRLDWLPDDVREKQQRIIDTIKETAAGLDFAVTNNGWLLEDRPSFTRLIRWALGEDLGGTVANYYSAVAHGTQYGLASAVISVDSPAGSVGPRRAALGSSSSDVSLALGLAGMALITALENEKLLMGRDWPTWEASRAAAQVAFTSAFEN